MDFWIFLAYLAVGIAASLLAVVKNMHMFQLNSYKPGMHCNWILRNIPKLGTQIFAALLVIPIFFLNHIAIPIALSGTFLLFCWLVKPAKNVKKPLVYTSRMKRMLATVAILLAGGAALAYFVPAPCNFIVILAIYALTPLAPLVANLINAPIEALVRRRYINEAKKILKSHPNLLTIGIAGSYGKTSVKFYLSTLLKAKYNVLMTPESYNTPMGIVKTIREQLRSTHEIFVCEMGERQRGDVKELCDIVFPQHGILTSIGEQHLETFKTLENVRKTIFELADSVADKGIAFLNGDNEQIRSNLPNQPYKTYGLNEYNNFRAYDIRVTQDGTTFSLKYDGEVIENLQTPLIGEHNVVNLAGVIGMSLLLGVSSDDIRTRLKKITPPPHRLQLRKHNGVTIIDDSYNSNPNGCEAALKTLALFDGCKILITPGMVELGTKQDECNFEFGVKAAAACDYVILVGEKQTKPIFDGLQSVGYEQSKIFVADSFNTAISKAYSLETDRDKVILLENDLPDNY